MTIFWNLEDEFFILDMSYFGRMVNNETFNIYNANSRYMIVNCNSETNKKQQQQKRKNKKWTTTNTHTPKKHNYM